MGFDIEVNSSNPSMMPQSPKKEDKVFQISCVVAREGDDPKKMDKYLLSLGDPDEDIVGTEVLVYTYETEAEMLVGFTDLIREENPNIITGYNILGFDIPYMIARAKSPACCIREFSKQGFHKYAQAKEKTISWSSSAYKNQEFEFLDAEGRIYVDLLPLVRRDYKFNNYKLKTISTYFLGQTKDPLSVKGIFKCYRIGVKKNKKGEYDKKARRAMAVVGKYCVQDSLLVVRLMDKLKTWVGLTEMAKTCQVPIFTLYTQGQQIKVYSQLYKYCMYQNIVVEKDAYKVGENERYVGAKVFLPVPGQYKMVVPFDFASLYPTTIIAYNIDYHTWVPDDSSIPDHMCHVMEWEDHISCEHDPKIQRKLVLTQYLATERLKIKAMRERRNKCLDKLRRKEMMAEINDAVEKLKPYTLERSEITKTISKFPMCEKRRYRFLKKPKGVMPTILQNLLDARKHTRKVDMARVKKEIKTLEEKESDNTMLITAQKTLLDVLNKRQLSYKISANSVGATTPIPCELNGEFVYRTIEEISKGDWKRINEEQEVSTPLDGLRVWSDLGFTIPKYVMRHPQDGKLIRTVTHTGMVETTNDHSLLRPNGDEVKPRDLRVGDKLMHYPTPLPMDTPIEPLFQTISKDVIENYNLKTPEEEMAFVYGLFMAEGTAGTWGKRLNAKSSWIIFNSDIDLLERACEILNRLESVGENTFKIVLYPSNKDHSSKLDMYHLTCRGKVKKLCNKYRELLYDNRSHKKIPDYILTSSLRVRQSFLMGYYAGDGARRIKCGVILMNKGHRVSAQLMYLARSLGYKVSLNYPEKKQTLISRLQCSTRMRDIKKSDSIKLIYPADLLEPLRDDDQIVRNGQLIQHVSGQSEYRRITLKCERLPRQKLLDSLDDAVEKAARIRKCYITEYNTKTKKIKLVKYCCGAIHWAALRNIKKEMPCAHKREGWCDCKYTGETNYNMVNEYKMVPYVEYVYDIETENHHFAAGVGNIIVHNSMYGAMGVRRGYLPFMPGAMCTTYMGRENITRVAEELTQNYRGNLVYGEQLPQQVEILC
jgi:DNA polymerase elongation subunit (family B)